MYIPLIKECALITKLVIYKTPGEFTDKGKLTYLIFKMLVNPMSNLDSQTRFLYPIHLQSSYFICRNSIRKGNIIKAGIMPTKNHKIVPYL